MKKLFLFLAIVLTLVFALTACDDNGGSTEHTHAFGEWVVVKEATDTEDGKKLRICACGEQETETIPKTQSGGGNTSESGGQSTHTHTYDQKSTASKYLKSDATCTSAAVYYYSCSCGEKGTSTFTSGSVGSHAYNQQNTSDTYLKSAATEQSPAVYYYSCACGKG